MKKILARCLLFVFLLGLFSVVLQVQTHAASGLPNVQSGASVNAVVPPTAADYQFALSVDTPHSLWQDEISTYTITYGASESAGLDTPITIVAHYSNVLAPDNSRVVDYIIGSATEGYGNVKPVVDLINRTITWYLPSLPQGTMDQHVSFQIITNSSYRDKTPVSFTTSASMSNQYATMPTQAITQSYLFDPTKVKPGPTPTPGPPNTPTPTIAPPVLQFYKISLSTIMDKAATVDVTTSQPARTFLLYGTSPKTLLERTQSSQLTRNTSIDLANLQPNTTYYFEVVSTDGSGKSYFSEIFEFKTAALSVPPNLDQSIFVIANGTNILLSTIYQTKSSQFPTVLLLPKSIFSLQLKLTNNVGIKTVAIVITDTTLGANTGSSLSHSNQVVFLQQETTGVFSGNLTTPSLPGRYDILAQVTDNNGNIVEKKMANLRITPPLTVLDSATHKPIADARVNLKFFNPVGAKYQTLPDAFAPGMRNPSYTDVNGEYRVYLPGGKYEAEISALGYKSASAAFLLGSEDNQDFPTIYLERDVFNVPSLLTFMGDLLQDMSQKTQQLATSLIQSPRVFEIVATAATGGFVLLGYLLFTIRAQIQLKHFVPFLLFSVAVARNKHKEVYLSGSIRDTDTEPLGSVQIDVIDPKAKTVLAHTQTTAAGTFHIKNNFATGIVLFLLTKEGFAPQEVAVDTHAKDSLTYTLAHHGDTKPFVVEELHHLVGSLFEVSLVFSLILELMFFMTFGAVQTLPFLALSLVNIFLWLFYLEEHTRL